MDKVEKVKEKVDKLYQAKNPQRDDWADWLFENHIFEVAKEASELATRFGAKKDLAMAAGMLHDIADSVMSRVDEKHEEKSLLMARKILEETGFSKNEIELIVEDIIKLHSCYDGHTPNSLEGKAMATADAVIHLKTDFYGHAFESMKKEKTIEEIKKWALPKIERDFNDKIFFNEVRREIEPEYERLKSFFQRLV